MKFRRRPSPLIFLLLPILLPTVTARSITPPSSDSSLLAGKITYIADDPIVPASKANPVGTKDAPVDGKDGLPHQGPFVETGAERDRKRIKVSDDEEPATPQNSPGVDTNSKVPVSNNGVMDDRNRLGPKEGTRGTEGGLSEKSKDTKYAEKVPDSPKEKLPLPHSEEPKIDGKGVGDAIEEEKQLLEVLGAHLSSWYAMLMNSYRSLKICPTSLMTSLLRTIQFHANILRSCQKMASLEVKAPLLLLQNRKKKRVPSSSHFTPSFSLSL